MNYAVLHQLANTEKEHELLKSIEAEKIEDVRDAWLEEFYGNMKCQKCGQPVQHPKKGKTIVCQCGAEYRIYR